MPVEVKWAQQNSAHYRAPKRSKSFARGLENVSNVSRSSEHGNDEIASVSSEGQTSAVEEIGLKKIYARDVMDLILSKLSVSDPGVVSLYLASKELHAHEVVKERAIAALCARAFMKPSQSASLASLRLFEIFAKIDGLSAPLRYPVLHALSRNAKNIGEIAYGELHEKIVTEAAGAEPSLYNDYLNLQIMSATRVEESIRSAALSDALPHLIKIRVPEHKPELDRERLASGLMKATPSVTDGEEERVLEMLYELVEHSSPEKAHELLVLMLDNSAHVSAENAEVAFAVVHDLMPRYIAIQNNINPMQIPTEIERLQNITFKLAPPARRSGFIQIAEYFPKIEDRTVRRTAIHNFLERAFQLPEPSLSRQILENFDVIRSAGFENEHGLLYKNARLMTRIDGFDYPDLCVKVGRKLPVFSESGTRQNKTIADIMGLEQGSSRHSQFINAISKYLHSDLNPYKS